MAVINHYKLRDGVTLDDIQKDIVNRKGKSIEPHALFGVGGSWINERDAHFISCQCGNEDISLNIGFPADLSLWNDFDDVLVMDENFAQPYDPFYIYMDREKDSKPFPFLLNVIGHYNRIMDSFSFLERK